MHDKWQLDIVSVFYVFLWLGNFDDYDNISIVSHMFTCLTNRMNIWSVYVSLTSVACSIEYIL